jgi:predicted membrane metal-binding protein
VGAQAVVWVATAAVLGAQLAPWHVSARWLAVAGTALAGIACGRRTRFLALAAVAVLAAAAGRAGLPPPDPLALGPDDVGAVILPLHTTIEGEVADIRRGMTSRSIILLRAAAIDDGGVRRRVGGLVRLTAGCQLPKLRAGDVLRAETTLRAPRGFANPGSFDVTGHLARRGVRVIASVWRCELLVRLPRPTRNLAVRLARWRERLARGIARDVPAPRAGVLRALVLGDESGIDDVSRRAFTRAGVVHVLSVSGFHVGLVALASFALVRWLLARSECALIALDVRRIAAVASLGPVALYGALAGFEVATLRSAIMAGVGVLAVLLGRRIDVLRTLALAAVAVALVQPGADPLPDYEAVAVLHPPADWTIPALNETSLTMRLGYGSVGVLLTGDVEARAEASLLANRSALSAAVLKVPHHGSRTSSVAQLVRAAAPRVAVISVGADNRYHLPSPEVENRYREAGVCLLRTDRCGAVTVVTDGRAIDVTAARPGCACPDRSP